ncbi:MAG: peptidylprolyl isomerase [Rhodospirillaceae bacterium]
MFQTRFFVVAAFALSLLMCFAFSAEVFAQAAPAAPAAKAKPPAVVPLAPPKPKPSPTGQPASQAPAAKPKPAAPAAPVPPKETVKLDPEFTLYLDLEYGRVVIRMRPDLAPVHVARVKELTRQGFYDGVVFHRVIDGFMAQTGDPQGDGTGGSGKNIQAEFNKESHVRGAVSMARAANINSADSQFFIVLQDSTHLDGNYTLWGQVVSGMEFVDRIRKGDPSANGRVPYPDRIIRMQVAADADKAKKK